MVDNVSKEIRKKTMQAVKAKKTKLEEKITKELWKKGFRFQKNNNKLMGKPDISIKKYKIVIFIDSCFWHICPKHFRMPSSNRDYWEYKIKRNKERDVKVNEYYISNCWNLFRIWEHDIKDNFEGTIKNIIEFIEDKKHFNLAKSKIM